MSLIAAIERRIATADQLSAFRSRWALAGLRVVFTNGCFDLIHDGHLRYLAAARELGDILVVGLNSDASVQRLKGPQRPVKNQDGRALLLASLLQVDLVVIFDEDTPADLIRMVHPDVLVKGGDWAPEAIVGADFVLGYGGQVLSLPFHEGHSTTRLVDRIRGRED